MAYREKLAWLTLIAMVVAYGAYFIFVAQTTTPATPPLYLVGVFAGVTIAQALVVVVASIVIAAMTQQAQQPRDERDRAIARRGAAAAYYVLLVGMIVVGVVMPFNKAGWQITNAALLVLVIAETVRYGLIVHSYRRGWHG